MYFPPSEKLSGVKFKTPIIFGRLLKFKFVKSYNGWPVIKERLEKEYGIMASEDICIKDELDGCSISLEGADDENREELEGKVQELVDIEKRLEACRVATMGRLSELGLIKWKIGPNTSSEYTIVKEG